MDTNLEFNNQLIKLKEKLNRFAFSLTTDWHDANDLLQDTFLRALKYQEKFRESSNLNAWVYQIMKNIFINDYHRKTKRNTIFDSSEDIFLLNKDRTISPENTDSRCNIKEINTAIDGLDEDLRSAFRLYTHGYKYNEIAELLGVKIGTVKSRIFLSRKKLIKILNDYN